MAIIQISKIQQRSGNLVDLPQLDQAEFGWASDASRLFIGKTATGGNIENVEVLTSYSNISFSQLDGAGGNLNISNALTGQILTFIDSSNTWVNAGGNALDPGNSAYYSNHEVHLGNVSTLKLGGGAIGYVLQTDGAGNLSWTPKGTLYTNIIGLSNANPVVMTVANTTPYVNGQEITITGAVATNANAIINGQNFFVKLSNNFNTTGNVSLYTDSALTTSLNGSTLGTYTANSGIAISLVGSGAGGANAQGANNSVQFNNSGILDGSANFTFTGTVLALTGNANITGNLNVTGNVTANILRSNVATGSAPIVVSSTTRVSNLNVSYSNVADFVNVTTVTTGTFYPILANALSGNVQESANSNLSFNAATGTLNSTLYNGTLTTAAQPNITSLGTLTSLSTSGNANIGNIGTAGLITATGNVTGGNITTGGVVSATGNINGGNINSPGVISAAGNVIGGNITTAGIMSATGNITGGNLITGNDLNVVGNANVGILTAGFISSTSNISAGNIISNGILSSAGNANVGNINVNGHIIPTANVTYDLGNSTNLFRDLYLSGTSIKLGTQTLVSNALGISLSNSVFATDLVISANSNVGNLSVGGVISVTGNANVGNIDTTTINVGSNANVGNLGVGGLIISTGNITGGNLITTGLLSVTGNATLGNVDTPGIFAGNGSGLSAIAGANVTGTVANATYATSAGSATTATSATTAGTVTTAAQANITSVGTLTGLTVSGATSVTGNSALTVTNITTGANTTLGYLTGNWTLTSGSRLQATYADLAEYYTADINYEPGTVLEFGGEEEVTIASITSNKVAGVVSSDPAYAMNAKCPGIAVAIALQGRVPVKVKGSINKGDLMISGGAGYAVACSSPTIGSVIGKSLQNFNGAEGIIEIAVGRI